MTSSKLHEVQDYLSLTGHVYSPAFVTTGAGRWERHPEDVRAEVEAIAREMQAFVYETAARMDGELLAELEATEMGDQRGGAGPLRVRQRARVRRVRGDRRGGQSLIDRARAAGSGEAGSGEAGS